MAKLIELNHVNKIYGKEIKTQVLYDINLSFEANTFNSIIGASGSGKSTLLNIMGTIDRQTSGEVLIDAVETSSINKNKLAELRNQTIGFVFQFHYLLPEFTALENVIMPYLIKEPRPRKEIYDKARLLMDLMGLNEVTNNLAGNMSGGQQQRTAIARALINDPQIVLADEPTGNLDSESTENIYKILREVNEKYKTTFVIITHDRRIAEKTDRIIEIKDGHINMDLMR